MGGLLPSGAIRHLSGFGMSRFADGYVFQPRTLAEMSAVFKEARDSNRKVVIRGAGKSYGDAAIGTELVILEMTKFNSIPSWDAYTGVIECQGGVTLEEIWRLALPHGWWLPVVSGTMKPTLAGALAMNIHGKNNWLRGTLGEHVLELELLLTSGEVRQLTPKDDLFFAVVSGAGLLGVITRVKLQLKRVTSGDVRVEAFSCRNWNDQFEAFDRYEGNAEYVVSWIDCFAKGEAAGRGILHAAWHEDEPPDAPSLNISHQDLPSKVLGIFPKSFVWRFLRLFNNPLGMCFVNTAKHFAGAWREHGKTHKQSLAAYNFLLDYVPGWEKAYLPGGLVQCQFFIPKLSARRVFQTLVEMQQEAGLESYLAVMKRHRPDRFLLSHAVDGYSLALDFKVTNENREVLWRLAEKMNELALQHGGRFYFAKDSTLTADQAARFLGKSLDAFRELKKLYDPEGLLTSELAQRVGLV
jgi:decaprenylphospho-beta-D-ribofuranose 2-oxidase